MGSHDPSQGGFIGHLRVVRHLGSGTMGDVYLAQDPQRNNDLCAVKVLNDNFAADEEAQLRFQREVETQARVSGHPGIVKIFHAGRTPHGRPYFAMEVIGGESFEEWLKRGLGPQQSVGVIAQAAAALAFAHERGLVHRDVKPENLMVDEQGRAKVTDFGLAKALAGARHDHLTRTGEILGTPAFMAPEQANPDFGEVGPYTDVYGLAATTYYALSAEVPHPGGTAIEIYSKISQGARATSLARKRPDEWGRRLAPVIDKALSPRPEDRYPDAGAFGEAFRSALSEGAPGARSRLVPALAGLALLSALGAAGSLVVAAQRSSDPSEAARSPTPSAPPLSAAELAAAFAQDPRAARALLERLPPDVHPPEAAWILACAGELRPALERALAARDGPTAARLAGWLGDAEGWTRARALLPRARALALAQEFGLEPPEGELESSPWTRLAAAQRDLRAGALGVAEVGFQAAGEAKEPALRLAARLGRLRVALAQGELPRAMQAWEAASREARELGPFARLRLSAWAVYLARAAQPPLSVPSGVELAEVELTPGLLEAQGEAEQVAGLPLARLGEALLEPDSPRPASAWPALATAAQARLRALTLLALVEAGRDPAAREEQGAYPQARALLLHALRLGLPAHEVALPLARVLRALKGPVAADACLDWVPEERAGSAHEAARALLRAESAAQRLDGEGRTADFTCARAGGKPEPEREARLAEAWRQVLPAFERALELASAQVASLQVASDGPPGPPEADHGPAGERTGPGRAGDQRPGDQRPGDQRHGEQRPGHQPPGAQRPGDQRHGAQRPGDQRHGGQSPGDQRHGDQRHGDQRPGEQRPGERRHGDQRHGAQRPGDQRPGDQRPGDQRHGEQRHGDQRHGAQRPGDQRHGDQRPGASQPGTARTGAQPPRAQRAGAQPLGAERRGAEPDGSQRPGKELAAAELARAGAALRLAGALAERARRLRSSGREPPAAEARRLRALCEGLIGAGQVERLRAARARLEGALLAGEPERVAAADRAAAEAVARWRAEPLLALRERALLLASLAGSREHAEAYQLAQALFPARTTNLARAALCRDTLAEQRVELERVLELDPQAPLASYLYEVCALCQDPPALAAGPAGLTRLAQAMLAQPRWTAELIGLLSRSSARAPLPQPAPDASLAARLGYALAPLRGPSPGPEELRLAAQRAAELAASAPGALAPQVVRALALARSPRPGRLPGVDAELRYLLCCVRAGGPWLELADRLDLIAFPEADATAAVDGLLSRGFGLDDDALRRGDERTHFYDFDREIDEGFAGLGLWSIEAARVKQLIERAKGYVVLDRPFPLARAAGLIRSRLRDPAPRALAALGPWEARGRVAFGYRTSSEEDLDSALDLLWGEPLGGTLLPLAPRALAGMRPPDLRFADGLHEAIDEGLRPTEEEFLQQFGYSAFAALDHFLFRLGTDATDPFSPAALRRLGGGSLLRNPQHAAASEDALEGHLERGEPGPARLALECLTAFGFRWEEVGGSGFARQLSREVLPRALGEADPERRAHLFQVFQGAYAQAQQLLPPEPRASWGWSIRRARWEIQRLEMEGLLERAARSEGEAQAEVLARLREVRDRLDSWTKGSEQARAWGRRWQRGNVDGVHWLRWRELRAGALLFDEATQLEAARAAFASVLEDLGQHQRAELARATRADPFRQSLLERVKGLKPVYAELEGAAPAGD